jgi:hypothetical protein
MDTYYDPIEHYCTRCRTEIDSLGLCAQCAATPPRDTASVYAQYADLYEPDQNSQVDTGRLFNVVTSGNVAFFEQLAAADEKRKANGVEIRAMEESR